MEKDYIDVTIEEGKTAYEAVWKYICRFWDREAYDDVIVRLGISYDNIEWDVFNEFVSFNADDFECFFENDWWEGERFIRLYGIVPLYDIEVSGGLYPD